MVSQPWNAIFVSIATVLAQGNGTAEQPPAAQVEGAQGANPTSNFQPYVFWAYGVVCGLIFLFTLWTVWEARRLERKIEYLDERFRRAHPGQN
jgi:hypothetical protein